MVVMEKAAPRPKGEGRRYPEFCYLVVLIVLRLLASSAAEGWTNPFCTSRNANYLQIGLTGQASSLTQRHLLAHKV